MVLLFYFLIICFIFIFDRFERAQLQPVTRTLTGKLPVTRLASDVVSTPNRPGAIVKSVTQSPIVNSKQIVVGHKASAEEIKEKMEQELRAQRAEHHKKRTLEMMQQKKGKRVCRSFYFIYSNMKIFKYLI